MLENIKLAIQGVLGHKMRSLLTMLGIIIGIASIITIVSTIQGTEEQIKKSVVGSGTNAVVVRLYKGEYQYDYYDNSGLDGITELTEDTRKELAKLDHAENASLYHCHEYTYEVFAGTASFSGAVYGIDRNYFDVNGYSLNYGRGLLQSDFDNCMKICFLDSTAVTSLLPGVNPIGRSIEIKGVPFTVVGVVSQQTSSDVVINSIEDYYSFAGNSTGKVFIPDSAWPIAYGFDEPLMAAVRADSPDAMTKVGKSAADLITQKHIIGGDSELSYRSVDLMEQAEMLQDLSSSNNRMLLWIASISLLVGGIGVMNIMLVSVTERTSEIGLKKAIGAKRKRILSQFLTEAAVLTGLGGLIGVLVGVVMAILMAKITGIPSVISIPAVLGAVIFSTIIGVLFGMIPAVKASNLNPIEALRRE